MIPAASMWPWAVSVTSVGRVDECGAARQRLWVPPAGKADRVGAVPLCRSSVPDAVWVWYRMSEARARLLAAVFAHAQFVTLLPKTAGETWPNNWWCNTVCHQLSGSVFAPRCLSAVLPL